MELENETREAENLHDEHTLKKGRHRKKQLYNSILQQMEFYFSDSNLTKDRFLSQLLKENNCVDLSVFLKFNKIKKLTSNLEVLQKAIKKSELIELSEDKTTVCRKEPVKEKLNVDECTVYVEHLNSDATHEWVSSVFSEFGNVVYVSIPKYKHNNVIKGFAFVEFDKEAEAEKAVSYFESIGCRIPSNTEAEQLCSIATFENSGDDSNVNKPDCPSNKRKFFDVDDNNENEESSKKVKTDGGEISESEDTESKKKKKLKKEHKKKIYIKELGLQVLPKREWKRMRNRYLDLQKKKMREFKQHLFKAKYSQPQYDKKKKEEQPKTIKIEKNEEGTPVVVFDKGLIVKVKLTEPVSDVKKLKTDVKSSSSDIQYVEIPNVGCEEIFIRFNNENGAANFCQKNVFGSKEVLSGEAEKAYWDKIQITREEKLNKTKKKQRGRDKLLKKAKHTKFDD